MCIFSVISQFPLKPVHHFLAVLPPPTLYKVETRKKFWIHASNIVCGVSGGVGPVWIEKHHRNAKVSQTLSTIVVCLFGFWLRNTSLVKVGNPISDGIVFVFLRFSPSWCVRGLQSLKRDWPYSIPFKAASRMGSLSNYSIWCLFFISNLMRSNVVYAAI